MDAHPIGDERAVSPASPQLLPSDEDDAGLTAAFVDALRTRSAGPMRVDRTLQAFLDGDFEGAPRRAQACRRVLTGAGGAVAVLVLAAALGSMNALPASAQDAFATFARTVGISVPAHGHEPQPNGDNRPTTPPNGPTRNGTSAGGAGRRGVSAPPPLAIAGLGSSAGSAPTPTVPTGLPDGHGEGDDLGAGAGNGAGTGAGNDGGNGLGNGNGDAPSGGANGATNGNANGAGNGNANGAGNGNAYGAGNGNASGNADGAANNGGANGNGNANGAGNGSGADKHAAGAGGTS
jgi:hypothetical protein